MDDLTARYNERSERRSEALQAFRDELASIDLWFDDLGLREPHTTAELYAIRGILSRDPVK